MDAPQNWPTAMRDLAALPLLQGLELSHALFPALGHNVAHAMAGIQTGSGTGQSVARRNHPASKSATQNQHRRNQHQKGCSRPGADALLEQFGGGEQPIPNWILAPVDLVLLIWLLHGGP